MTSLENTLQQDMELKRLEQALREGRISKQEYEYFLHKEYGISPQKEEKPSHTPMLALAAILIVASIIGSLWLTDGGITGFVVNTPSTQEFNFIFTNDTVMPLNITNTTSLAITGSLNGTATIYAQSANTTYLVAHMNSQETDGVWLDKVNYAINETINLNVLPSNASYTLWLVTQETREPVSEPLSVGEAGIYDLEVLINISGIIRKETITLTVRNDTNTTLSQATQGPSLTFTNECDETCDIAPTTFDSLIITVEGELAIASIKTTIVQENTAPKQVADIPNIAINASGSINLSTYFIDAQGDEILYEINNIIGIDEKIEGSMLLLNGSTPGTYQARVYASDLNAITTSNSFTITVLGSQETSQTNITNETSQTNETNQSTQTIEEPATQVATCDNPNINLRPPECFGNQLDAAYEDIIAPLTDKRGAKVGRFTRYGNLVIAGRVIEQSNTNPDNTDFVVGYTSREGFVEQRITTAFIDSSTGDLHLKGRLYQEEGALIAPQYDSYVIQNANGIVLAYFDEKTGDLYLKSNIVQLGRP